MHITLRRISNIYKALRNAQLFIDIDIHRRNKESLKTRSLMKLIYFILLRFRVLVRLCHAVGVKLKADQTGWRRYEMGESQLNMKLNKIRILSMYVHRMGRTVCSLLYFYMACRRTINRICVYCSYRRRLHQHHYIETLRKNN